MTWFDHSHGPDTDWREIFLSGRVDAQAAHLTILRRLAFAQPAARAAQARGKKKVQAKVLSARFELAIFRVSGERIDQLSHESEPLEWLGCTDVICVHYDPIAKQLDHDYCWIETAKPVPARYTRHRRQLQQLTVDVWCCSDS